MKKHIPNFITLINLFCGCCALLSIFYGNFMQAFWFLFAAGLADFLDGMFARLLQAKSPIGKELDSLADMVSFGIAPGAIIYMLLVKGAGMEEEVAKLYFFAAPAFVLSLFAALRLAKFNIDDRQSENFIGLPTPSAAMYVVGLMLIYHFDSFGLRPLVSNPYFLYGNVVLFSFLLVSRIPMFSFKFNPFKWDGNEIKIIFAAVSIIMLFVLQEAAFSLITLLYIVLALSINFFMRKNAR